MSNRKMSGRAKPSRALAAHHNRKAQRGLSIIEVMVGMVVALLVGVAAAGSAAMFTATQRQGIGTGGALVNSTTALNALRDDVAAAGLGFFGDSKYLCSKLNLSVDSSVKLDGADFTPIAITTETAGDRVDVVYATQVASGANVLLAAASTGGDAEVRSFMPVVSPAPTTAASQQAVLLAPLAAGDPCTVRSVTSVRDSDVNTTQKLTFANSGTYNKANFTTTPTYVDKARLALLGDLRWARYRMSGTNLQLERPLVANSTAVTIARNVVGFRAQYGLADASANSTALTSWQAATGTFASLTPATLPRVRALRIGIVTRSAEREKPNASGICTATDTTPTLFDTAVTPDVTDWKCYRYRTSIVVVPLRNLVMGTAS